MNFNKGTAIELRVFGRLGEIPSIRKTSNDISVTNISLAVNIYSPKSKDVETEWFDVTVWGKDAESIVKHSHKGQLIYVEANVTNDNESTVDESGKKRSFKVSKYNATKIAFLSAIKKEEEVKS